MSEPSSNAPRSRLTVLAAGAVLAAMLLSGCQWALLSGSDGPVGRRTCLAQEANEVYVDTTGFSGSQVGDIRTAIDWLRWRTGVQLQFVASPNADWWETDTDHILIERHSVVDGRGHPRVAYSKPYDRNGDRWYDAGVVWVDASANNLPSGRGWGPGGTNFFKLMVHELSHQLGVADVADPSELMGSTSVDQPGLGDGNAWDAVRC